MKSFVLCTAILALTCGSALAAVTPFDDGVSGLTEHSTPRIGMPPHPQPVVGDLVDFDAAMAAGADYLQAMQADITGDNAGNGPEGSESPDDPDDGGWDWVLTSPPDPFHHSTAASPTNIYGATAIGLYYSYLETSAAGYLTAMTDAANVMAGNASIRSAADLVFLMLFDDLPVVTGTTYQDAARTKYDARITTYGTATDLAEYIRDVRAGQGYENGIIAWDIGAWARVAAMLHDRYPGNGYDTDADAIAEVIYQDSFNDSPGYFDIIDDQGWDPTYTDKNFWWYCLGITGLVDAFSASGSHTAEIPGLVSILLDSQFTQGGISFSYGANPDDEDWQSTAYTMLSLGRLDQATYQDELNWMGYWIGATQDGSGGWLYSDNTHYPEIGGENTAGLFFTTNDIEDVIVDDDFTGQDDVDVYNAAHATQYVWGYTAFSSVQDGIDAVTGSIVNVAPGTYVGNIVIGSTLELRGAQYGVDARGRVAAESELTTSSGHLISIEAADVVIDGLKLTGGGGSAGRLLNADDTGSGLTVRNTIAGGVAETILWCNVTSPDMLFEQNEWDATGMSSYLAFMDGSDVFDNLIIRDNNLSGGEIFAGAYAPNSTGLVLSGNLFDGAFMNLSSQFEDALIDDNTFQNNGYTHAQVGLLNSTISNNTFHVAGPSPYAGYPSYALMLWGDQYGLAPSQNVTLENNTFYFNGVSSPDEVSHGLRLLSGLDPSTIHIHQNDFLDQGAQTGAFGLRNQGSGSADASCNWWGDAGGPDTPSNPNPSGAAIDGDAVYWLWLSSQGGDCDGSSNDTVDADGTGLCISDVVAGCAAVPVTFNRTDTQEARLASVTFQLSSELQLCGSNISSIHEGTWLSGLDHNFFVYDNGGGSYTVDQNINGEDDCGVTTGGLLFTVDVEATGSPGLEETGTLTITDVTVRDCGNPQVTLPGIPGAPAEVQIDDVPPSVITDLASTQLLASNPPGYVTQIDLAWVNPGEADFTGIEIWRKGFGDYPEYDDGSGSAPSLPPSYPPAGWTLVTSPALAAGTTTYADVPSVRDFYYYVAYALDDCDNVSQVSAMAIDTRRSTAGTLNYHLGDVAPAPGDNHVTGLDISALAASYGVGEGDPAYDPYVDVGPTSNLSTYGLPLTDNLIDFEDLQMFAINYGMVSFTLPTVIADLPPVLPHLQLVVEPVDASHFRARLLLADNPGLVKGVHAVVAHRGATPVEVSQGTALAGQEIFFTHLPENGVGIHAAVLGNGAVIPDDGEIASILFEGQANADVRLVLEDLRDVQNRKLGAGSTTSVGSGNEAMATSVPTRYELLGAEPNPFNPSTTIRFRLPEATQVSLRIYDVSGRALRVLQQGVLPAGEHGIRWDGRDSRGAQLGSGVYLYAIKAGEIDTVEKLVMLK